MIQFNLLPNVKSEYINVKQTKHKVLVVASGVIIGSLAIVILLVIVVFGWQNLRLKNLDDSIKETAGELQKVNDIDKVLTVQNQLESINSLHSAKPEVARLFGYLTQVTPSRTTIDTLNLDLVTPTMTISGQATNLEEVNKFVDTLKFTTISKGDAEPSGSDPKAFSQVVLSSYSISNDGASYTITLKYDSAIFNSAETDLKLTVPNIITTRSATEQPSDLFQENTTPTEGETGP